MPRSILVNPSPRAGGSGSWLRRRIAPLALATLATLALGAPVATPAHAGYDPESYMACVNAVADWTDSCKRSSDSILGDAACVAVGTAGILGCAIIEAIEQLGSGVRLP